MSSKFSSPLAEELWEASLESAQDDEIGESDGFGWFALFESDLSILSVDSQGFVYSQHFESAGDLHLAWTETEMSYDRWVMEGLDTSECQSLFLLVDTACHGGWTVTREELFDHVAECDTCEEWIMP